MSEDVLTAPWRQIAAKIDAFFAKVNAEHGDAMRCCVGCAACCRQELGVLLVEALAIVRAIEALPPAEQRALASRAASGGAPCVFLRDHRCQVYEGRPMVCRSHGLPVKQDGAVATCELNFVDGAPEGAVLDAGWVVATLTIANGILLRELGMADAPRFTLRELAERGRDALPDKLRGRSGAG